MSERAGYNRGYAEGYQAGLRDGLAGKLPGQGQEATLSLPIAYLDLSARARNCLCACGCETIADVAKLSEQTVARMRNLGKVTANEIACALHSKEIRHTPWDLYLLD